MALTLARPEGNPEGSRGLALFVVELRDEAGRLRGITVNRLKDKFGTRKVPTRGSSRSMARRRRSSAPATDGVRNDHADALGDACTWNAVSATSGMRRALALARDFARRRRAFGALLVDKPLHPDTLAGIEAELRGARSMPRVSLGASCSASSSTVATRSPRRRLARALVPIARSTTGKQAVAIASEAIEACGGAGYVEDTGLPRLLADAQVLPIWEGTTNVLSLDTLRALGKGGALEAIGAEIERCVRAPRPMVGSRGPSRSRAARSGHAAAWVQEAMTQPGPARSGGAQVRDDARPRAPSSSSQTTRSGVLDHGHGRAHRSSRGAAHSRDASAIDQIDDASLDDTKLLA